MSNLSRLQSAVDSVRVDSDFIRWRMVEPAYGLPSCYVIHGNHTSKDGRTSTCSAAWSDAEVEAFANDWQLRVVVSHRIASAVGNLVKGFYGVRQKVPSHY